MTVSATDFSQFTELRAQADRNDPAAMREVARQFEALFVQMMMKNMRAASFGDPLFGNSKQHEMYQDMMDQQLALDMSRGKGIGMAETIMRQLGASPEVKATDGPMTLPPRAAAVFERVRAFAQSMQNPPVSAPSQAAGAPEQAAATTAPAKEAAWTDPESFGEAVWPHVKRTAKALNVSPVAVLAQAALETGWGKRVMNRPDGASSNNLFGIKAGGSWDGESVSKSTLEFRDGLPRKERAEFRAYKDVSSTFDDYAEFLKTSPRYASVIDRADDIKGFAKALQSSGYATDPAYADKIADISNGPTMRRVLNRLASVGL